MTTEKIIEIVCQELNITPEQMQSKSRKKEFVDARQIIHYFCRKYTKNSLACIAKEVGGIKQHGTILKSLEKVNNHIETERKYKQLIDRLDWRINPPILKMDTYESRKLIFLNN